LLPLNELRLFFGPREAHLANLCDLLLARTGFDPRRHGVSLNAAQPPSAAASGVFQHRVQQRLTEQAEQLDIEMWAISSAMSLSAVSASIDGFRRVGRSTR
jgi:hypothetical protein